MTTISSNIGALPSQSIEKMIDAGFIKNANKKHVRPASLDLTISDEIYRIEHLFLPESGESVRDLLNKIEKSTHDIKNPMERGVTYLARLREKLILPKNMYAFCNPKSTTGRNDVHARVLADGVPRYDDISIPGWRGELWIAISPRSFPIKVLEGMTLSQIRFFNGDTRLDEAGLNRALATDDIILDEKGNAVVNNYGNIKSDDGSVTLTLDLSSDIIGYQCIEPGKVLELMKDNYYDASSFFIPITKNGSSISLREGTFYILSTCERVRIPPNIACEMRPMDERYGDFRAHYAGFIDPGWGWGKRGEGKGRTLTLEVRPFENLEVRHGQAIARIKFESMAYVPEMLYDSVSSNYITQEGPKLSKQFKQSE